MKKAITAGRLRALPLHLSADCSDFVNSMLEPNPTKRPSASSLLAHPFVTRNLGGPVPKAASHCPPRTLSTRGDSVSSTMDSFWSSQALISKQARPGLAWLWPSPGSSARFVAMAGRDCKHEALQAPSIHPACQPTSTLSKHLA